MTSSPIILTSKLFQVAKTSLKNSYSPYSHKQVAAGIRLTNGKVYSGVNIENASFGATVCAERVAIWKALSENPKAQIAEVLVVTDANPPWSPCGICRQVIAEFATQKTLVHVANKKKIFRSYLFSELLPHAFLKKDLKT